MIIYNENSGIKIDCDFLLQPPWSNWSFLFFNICQPQMAQRQFPKFFMQSFDNSFNSNYNSYVMTGSGACFLNLYWSINCIFLIIACVNRLGDFLKFLRTKFLAKVAQIFSNNFWLFWKMELFMSTDLKTFWAFFVENWATFYSNIWSHWLWLNCVCKFPHKLGKFHISWTNGCCYILNYLLNRLQELMLKNLQLKHGFVLI